MKTLIFAASFLIPNISFCQQTISKHWLLVTTNQQGNKVYIFDKPDKIDDLDSNIVSFWVNVIEPKKKIRGISYTSGTAKQYYTADWTKHKLKLVRSIHYSSKGNVLSDIYVDDSNDIIPETVGELIYNSSVLQYYPNSVLNSPNNN